MSTMITEECINCGACEPECPNDAISEGPDVYVIDADKCTECVGFHGKEACQAVCPVECCVPNEQNREDEALAAAAATWGAAEPWAHVSSPLGGWTARDPRVHADYIAPADVPRAWLGRRLTVDVEAKAKERAVLRLQRWARGRARSSGSATGSRAARRAPGTSCPGGA